MVTTPTERRLMATCLRMIDAWIAEQPARDRMTLQATRYVAVARLAPQIVRIAALVDLPAHGRPN
jgi:hypothetical protein